MSQTVDWNEVLDVGLPLIDEQHKELIDISNGLIQAMINGMGMDVLEDTFKQLRDYTEKHFADEEVYMAEINYPGIDGQKLAHRRLVNEVDDFHDLLAKGQMSPNKALDFINGWIVKHIIEMDSKIGEYVLSQK